MHIFYFADIRFPLERANGIQTMETCHALARRAHEVTLVVRPDTVRPPRDPFGFYALPPHLRFRLVRTPGADGALARRLAYLACAVGRASAGRAGDVILTRDLGVAAALLRIPKRLRPPLVYESHGFAPAVSLALPELLNRGRPASPAKQRRLTRREQFVWARAEGYVAITKALANELTTRFGSRGRLAVVPDGARVTTTSGLEPAAQTHFRKSQRPLVGYVGHLYPWKGVDLLLVALTLVPEVDGLIVGGHPDEPDLARTRARAHDLGLDQRTTFTGLVGRSEAGDALGRADVLVLPNAADAISAHYTSPLKLFEYMAAARPIVASDLPAVREVLRDRENAVLVEPGNPAALAAGIRLVFADPELARRIARQALADAGQYTWDRRAERLEHLLATVTKGARE